jgi:Uma2 family endonuclease
MIVSGIIGAAAVRQAAEPAFAFESIATTGFDLAPIQDAYIPDVVLIDRDRSNELLERGIHYVLPSDIAMVVEITSRTNARNDRAPGPQLVRADGTYPKWKWTGYARCGVPFYLVIDCDPKVAGSLLYSNPDIGDGCYLDVESSPLGDPIRLPDPIGLTIPTDRWRTWS